jgi:hypothetical protein
MSPQEARAARPDDAGGGEVRRAPDPAPTFSVVDARAVPHAAAPTLAFRVRIAEGSGREIYTIALAVQVHVDPAQRTYDAETRERLVELFGDPERWAATTRSFLWQRVDVLVPPFTGEAELEVHLPCTYDQELAAAKYFSSLPDGRIPLTFHLSGTILYRGEADRLQMVQVPWSASAAYRMPVEVWARLVDHYYPDAAWVRVGRETMDLLAREKARRGLPTLDACVAELLREAAG